MPNAILDWGLEVIAWLQRASPTLDWPFRALTALGNIEFVLIFLPLIYWALDRETGIRLGVYYVISALVNGIFKAAMRQPRPRDYSADVITLTPASSFGLPSGHSQNTVVFWGAVAAHWRQRWVRLLAAAMIVLIPLSRMYLGVHFPTDVLGGYILGAVLLWTLLTYAHRLPQRVSRVWLPPTLALTALVVLMPFLARLPADAARGAGALAGLTVGLALERRQVRFRVDGPAGQRLARAALGLAVLAMLYLGWNRLLVARQPDWLWQMLHYALLGLWITWVGPAVFVWLGLADRDPRPER